MTLRQYGPPRTPPGLLDEDGYDEEATVAIDRSMVSSRPRASLAPLRPDHAWYLAVDGAQSGPFETADLGARVASGEVPRTASVWREGFKDWAELATVAEFRGFMERTRLPAPAQPAALAPAALAPASLAPAALPSNTPIPSSPITTAWGTHPTATPSPLARNTLSDSPFTRSVFPLGRLTGSGRTLSPWQWMVLAAAVGFGASFVLLKLIGPESAAEGNAQASEAVPAASSIAPEREANARETTTTKLEGLQTVASNGSEQRESMAEVTAQGALASAQARAAVGKRLQSAREDCWAKARQTHRSAPTGSVSASVRLQVDATGYVFQARSLGHPAGYPGLGLCIANRALGWTFPTSSGLSKVTLRVTFAD